MTQRVYLDYNATTPVHPDVLAEMEKYCSDYGNPSSIYSEGSAVRVKVEEARERVATFIGAMPEEIIFTSGGSEANNQVLFTLLLDNNAKPGTILVSAIEHASVLQAARLLQSHGFNVEHIPVTPKAEILPITVQEMLTDDTQLVSVMYANNEVGTIQPIQELVKSAEEKSIPFHCDAIQALGKLPIDVKALGVSYLSLSAHKCYGPKGIGALYVKSGTPIHPLIYGGSQERMHRAGTENVPGILGFAKAIECLEKKVNDDCERIHKLRDDLSEKLQQTIPNSVIHTPSSALPNTLAISFDGVAAEAIVMSLDLVGISVSSGSACSTGTIEVSHVLQAMGVTDVIAKGAIRLSLGKWTTPQHIEVVMQELPPIIERLRRVSNE